MAESDKKRFKLELNQFEKLGYYIKVKNKKSDKNSINSEENKVIIKKRSNNIIYPKESKKSKDSFEVEKAKTPCKSNARVGKNQKKIIK